MTAMPQKREKYVHRDESRHGQIRWYFHPPGQPKVRLPGLYGSHEFSAALAKARDKALDEPTPQKAGSKGSVAWLWQRYQEVPAWKGLAEATRRQRLNIMKPVLAAIGDRPAASIRKKDVVASRDKRTPTQGRNFLDAIRGMYEWGTEAELIPHDPTAGISYPKREKGPGFLPWTEDEIDRYYSCWPLGTRQRVWIDVLLYTGGRRGDAVLIGRQHVRNGIATFWTEKSGERIEVTIPILPILQASLDAGPCGDLAFICGERGKPLTKESFGNMFKAACRAANINEGKKSAHGLRKVAATRAAENGATAHQLMAIFGWTDIKTAELYTKAANRRRLSHEGISALVRT